MQTECICLGLLTNGPKSGYEIKQFLSGPLNQIMSLSFGTIYPTLNRLLKDELVSCRQKAQEKKPDKKIYSITKKGQNWFKKSLLENNGEWLRSGNYSDQVKSEFLMLILFSEFLPKETTDLLINERLLFAKQVLALLKYNGPVSTPTGAKLRSSAQGIFLRGLMVNIITTSIEYIENNRNKLRK